MNPEDIQELIERMDAFSLDESGVSFPFTSRLAREQGWSHAYGARVVNEYKRFICMAVVAGHPVTPSEEVDHVWHLHLIYTKSYWHQMCRDILGVDVHHGPTVGGVAEQEKFTDWYEQTLASYRTIFSEEPSAEIWPPSRQRFAAPTSGQWVNRHRFWLIPRPSWTQVFWWKMLFRR